MRTASLSRDAGHMDHYAQAREDAMNATGTVRRLNDQVTDGIVRSQIENRLAKLDQLILTI